MDLSRVRHGESPFLALLSRVSRYPCLGMSGYSQRTHSWYLLRILYRLARLAQRLQHPLLLTLLLPLSHAALRTPLRNSTCTPLAPAGAEGARRSPLSHDLQFVGVSVFGVCEGHHQGLLGPPEVLVKEDPPPAYDRGQNPSPHSGQLVVAQRLFYVHPGVQAAPAALVGRSVGTNVSGRACPPALSHGRLLRHPAVPLLYQVVLWPPGRPRDTKAPKADHGCEPVRHPQGFDRFNSDVHLLLPVDGLWGSRSATTSTLAPSGTIAAATTSIPSRKRQAAARRGLPAPGSPPLRGTGPASFAPRLLRRWPRPGSAGSSSLPSGHLPHTKLGRSCSAPFASCIERMAATGRKCTGQRSNFWMVQAPMVTQDKYLARGVDPCIRREFQKNVRKK